MATARTAAAATASAAELTTAGGSELVEDFMREERRHEAKKRISFHKEKIAEMKQHIKNLDKGIRKEKDPFANKNLRYQRELEKRQLDYHKREIKQIKRLGLLVL